MRTPKYPGTFGQALRVAQWKSAPLRKDRAKVVRQLLRVSNRHRTGGRTYAVRRCAMQECAAAQSMRAGSTQDTSRTAVLVMAWLACAVRRCAVEECAVAH